MLIARRKDQAKYPQAWDELEAAWYPGAGPSGTRLYDLSGRDNHCTLTNGPTWVDAQGGKAIQLDGVNDFGIVSAKNLNVGSGSFSFWASSTVAGNYRLLGNRDAATGAGVDLYVTSGGSIGAYNTSIGSLLSPGSLFLFDGTMNHYSILIESGVGLKMFRNGTPLYSTATAGSINSSNNDFYIGRFPPSAIQFFNGRFADILIHSRALRNDEVKLLAQRPGILLEPKPRVFYSIASSVKAWLFRRQSQIIGGGLG